ncbi:MAG: GNAT family N-acetyltransferase [Butyrivibrio sp.]|nr:GNAT family N-acetyltransferase [Butyrivibrio sp.]
MIIAKEFAEQDKEQLLDMVNEINKYDADFEGLVVIRSIEDYNLFLKKLGEWKHQELINPNFSPQTTFGVFDDKKLVGGFVLRHTLKGTLINNGGNIGYLVRPSKRKMGYGKILLKLALEKARDIGLQKVLVTCRNDNIGSAKVIESNGGVYENDYYDINSGKTYRRYWIQCE